MACRKVLYGTPLLALTMAACTLASESKSSPGIRPSRLGRSSACGREPSEPSCLPRLRAWMVRPVFLRMGSRLFFARRQRVRHSARPLHDRPPCWSHSSRSRKNSRNNDNPCESISISGVLAEVTADGALSCGSGIEWEHIDRIRFSS
jgi:hypothetical protein